jgi:YidC/Oxa1 family membrane protein insertase
MFTAPAWLVSQFYSLTHNYTASIALVAFAVMVLVTPLTLKSTKGMLEMQRLQPEMKRLQAQYRGDRQKLNEEMMKLYQEHKVNPLASCLPLVIQMPVFFIMYRVLRGLTRLHNCTATSVSDVCNLGGKKLIGQVFDPEHISKSSALYKSLKGQTEMLSFGLDLSKSPAHFIGESVGKGLIYATLVVILGLLYFAQQKMVASRAAVSPTMSPTQAKLMQYLPVVFAVFQIFFLTGLVIYYITQALFRIGQNFYITKKFYGHEDSIGRQAQRAGERAREEAKANGGDKAEGGGGMFAQAKRDAQARRDAGAGKSAASSASSSGRPSGRPAVTAKAGKPAGGTTKSAPASTPEPIISKRVTPPKNRPTPAATRPQRPTASGRPGAPARPKPPKK